MVRAAAIAAVLVATSSAGMQLRSSDFSAGARLPKVLMASDCGGENRSPALTWTNAPRNAKSFALIVHDADAPIPGGFYHWVVYNLSPATQRLAGNAKLSSNQLGDTSAGRPGYYGPCPPPGPAHHYTLRPTRWTSRKSKVRHRARARNSRAGWTDTFWRARSCKELNRGPKTRITEWKT